MKRSAGHTLPELLVTLVISVMVFSAVIQFFSQTWLSLNRTVTRVEANQLMPIVQKRWQTVLSGTDPASWKVDGNALSAGDVRCSQEGRNLAVVAGGKKSLTLLPDTAVAKFSVESAEGQESCAVLEIKWSTKQFEKWQQSRVRLVACGRKHEKAQ